ncbi:hypothetical protein ACIP2Y_39425 [Streptomyces sviceus]|uniref:hypothetical protein n=1 Tax=Streptomyces sviceus TaxID=285530 RepID=UPI003811192F
MPGVRGALPPSPGPLRVVVRSAPVQRTFARTVYSLFFPQQGDAATRARLRGGVATPTTTFRVHFFRGRAALGGAEAAGDSR